MALNLGFGSSPFATFAALGVAIVASTAIVETSAAAPEVAAGVAIAPVSAETVFSADAPLVSAGVSIYPASAETVFSAEAPQVIHYIPARAAPRRTYLVEISGLDENDDPQTLRFSSGYGYTSDPLDSPARAFYSPGLKVTGQFESNLFEPGATAGVAQSAAGEIRIANIDGTWDHLIDWAFDGRTVTIKRLPDEETALSSATTVFTGSLQDVTFDTDGISFKARDKLDILKIPIQTERYAGTTTSALAGGIEGNADWAGVVKPLLYGVGEYLPAVPVNIFDHIYQVCTNVLTSIEAVYDRGVPLVWDENDYEDPDALEMAEVPGGAYATCLAFGLVKLGQTPDGDIRVDATEGGGSPSTNTPAQISERILLGPGGRVSGDLLAGTFSTLNAQNSDEIGIYITDERDVLDVLAEVLQWADATVVADRLGLIGVYRIDLPEDTDTPAATFTEDDVLDDDVELIPVNDGNAGIPPYEIVLNYRKNWAPASADELAGFVIECTDAERRAFLTTEWRKAVATDSAVKTRHPLGKPAEYESNVVEEAAATAEATRRLNLRKVKRPVLRFPVPAERAETLNKLDVFKFVYPRYGNTGGKLYRLIGTGYDFDADRILVSGWGGVTPA